MEEVSLIKQLELPSMEEFPGATAKGFTCIISLYLHQRINYDLCNVKSHFIDEATGMQRRQGIRWKLQS